LEGNKEVKGKKAPEATNPGRKKETIEHDELATREYGKDDGSSIES